MANTSAILTSVNRVFGDSSCMSRNLDKTKQLYFYITPRSAWQSLSVQWAWKSQCRDGLLFLPFFPSFLNSFFFFLSFLFLKIEASQCNNNSSRKQNTLPRIILRLGPDTGNLVVFKISDSRAIISSTRRISRSFHVIRGPIDGKESVDKSVNTHFRISNEVNKISYWPGTCKKLSLFKKPSNSGPPY